MARDTNDLLHGSLDVLALKAVSREPVHGYGISKWIEQRTNDTLEIVDSALCKALHRLEDAGAIAAEWGVSEKKRRSEWHYSTMESAPDRRTRSPIPDTVGTRGDE